MLQKIALAAQLLQGGPAGLVVWKKIILASLRYFFPRQAYGDAGQTDNRDNKK